jgi:hypothetical protein
MSRTDVVTVEIDTEDVESATLFQPAKIELYRLNPIYLS